jgi:hypothetical protein
MATAILDSKETILMNTLKRGFKIPKIIIVTTLIVTGFIFLPNDSMAVKRFTETKVSDSLSSGLDHLLALADPKNPDIFDLLRIENVLDFVTSSKSDSVLYYADKKFGADSAYNEFDIRSDLNHILRYAYNPDIPSFAFMPSSVRLSYWSEVNGQKQPLPKLWRFLSASASPVIVRGVEHIEITPDLFTGAYYRYDENKTLILCKHQGRNLLISIAKQKDKSDVGRKGLILGKDEDWHYFYSGQVGLTKTGLGWVNSYMYDSFSVAFYYELDKETPLVRCGMFKWLRAGWANMNLVNRRHIHRGMERRAKDLKTILEHPSLPKTPELTGIFSHYKSLSLDELRKAAKMQIKRLERLIDDTTFLSQRFAEHLKSGRYLNQMTRQEIHAILVLENMRSILKE